MNHSEQKALQSDVRGQLQGWVRGFRLVGPDAGLVACGRAGSYYAKQLAQHAVMAATDVPIVTNEIDVMQ